MAGLSTESLLTNERINLFPSPVEDLHRFFVAVYKTFIERVI